MLLLEVGARSSRGRRRRRPARSADAARRSASPRAERAPACRSTLRSASCTPRWTSSLTSTGGIAPASTATSTRSPRSRSGRASPSSAAAESRRRPLARVQLDEQRAQRAHRIRQPCSPRRSIARRPWPGAACGSSGSSSATARQLVGDADEVLDDAVVQLRGDAQPLASTRSSARRMSCSRSRSCWRTRPARRNGERQLDGREREEHDHEHRGGRRPQAARSRRRCCPRGGTVSTTTLSPDGGPDRQVDLDEPCRPRARSDSRARRSVTSACPLESEKASRTRGERGARRRSARARRSTRSRRRARQTFTRTTGPSSTRWRTTRSIPASASAVPPAPRAEVSSGAITPRATAVVMTRASSSASRVATRCSATLPIDADAAAPR